MCAGLVGAGYCGCLGISRSGVVVRLLLDSPDDEEITIDCCWSLVALVSC